MKKAVEAESSQLTKSALSHTSNELKLRVTTVKMRLPRQIKVLYEYFFNGGEELQPDDRALLHAVIHMQRTDLAITKNLEWMADDLDKRKQKLNNKKA